MNNNKYIFNEVTYNEVTDVMKNYRSRAVKHSRCSLSL